MSIAVRSEWARQAGRGVGRDDSARLGLVVQARQGVPRRRKVRFGGQARLALAWPGLELRVVAGSGRQGIDSSGAVRSGNDRQERTGAEWRVGDRSDAEWRGRQGLESF